MGNISIYLSIYIFLSVSVCLSVYLSVYTSLSLGVCMCACDDYKFLRIMYVLYVCVYKFSAKTIHRSLFNNFSFTKSDSSSIQQINPG